MSKPSGIWSKSKIHKKDNVTFNPAFFSDEAKNLMIQKYGKVLTIRVPQDR